MLRQTFVGIALLCLCLFKSEAAVARKEGNAALSSIFPPGGEDGPPDQDKPQSIINELAVMLINSFRENHQVPPLTYDPNLQILAKTCAMLYTLQRKKANEGKYPYHRNFDHNCMDVGDGNNEIIFHVPGYEINNFNVLSQQFHTFYDNVINANSYDFVEPDANKLEEQQYFTQMLWKSSTRMGCDCGPKQRLGTPDYICSCIFSPGGNIRTGFSSSGLLKYKENVLRKMWALATST